MQKKAFLIIGLLVVGTLLFSIRPLETQSAEQLPYPNVSDAPGQESCKQRTANEMTVMRDAWVSNLNQLTAQEKPASEMVDEGFESLRSYRCWLDYLCEAVLISAVAPDNSRLIEQQLTPLPGCQSPDALEIPGTQLQYLDQCRAVSDNGRVQYAQLNYETCKRMTGVEFYGEPASSDAKSVSDSLNRSGAFITLESKLKATNANQTNRALANKLASLLNKMHGMEAHVNSLRDQLKKLDGRLPCLIQQCD